MELTDSMAITLRDPAPIPTAMGASQESAHMSSADAEARRTAAAVARGDEAAFEELYDRYQARLLRLLVVLTCGDETLAGEVAQLAMLTAAAKLKPVETEAHLWNWLARVARQHLTKEWRRRRREPILVSLPESAEAPEPTETEAALDQGLDAALLALEEGDRQAVEWFYFDGLGHKEIAQRLETTPKAVSSRLERARAKLRSLLNQALSHET